jgi:hypothetical protein
MKITSHLGMLRILGYSDLILKFYYVKILILLHRLNDQKSNLNSPFEINSITAIKYVPYSKFCIFYLAGNLSFYFFSDANLINQKVTLTLMIQKISGDYLDYW